MIRRVYMVLLEVFPLGHIHSLPCKALTADILPAVRTVQDAAIGVLQTPGISHDHIGINICQQACKIIDIHCHSS